MENEDINSLLRPSHMIYVNRLYDEYVGFIEQSMPTGNVLKSYNMLLRSKMSQEIKEKRDKKIHMVDIVQ